jgi:uncharacterized oxidoreductase
LARDKYINRKYANTSKGNMQTSGNTILITGGGSGIGLELARAFARRNNRVIICGRDQNRLNAAQTETPGVEVRRCDLAAPADRAELVSWALEQFPHLNILVNNAAAVRAIDLKRNAFDFEQAQQELVIDLFAPIDLALRFLPHLRRQVSAAIVNVTTGQVYSPNATTPVYSAAKTGLHTWTDAMRYQLRDTPVKIFEVLPPIVDTDMIHRLGVPARDAISAAELAEAAVQQISANVEEIRIGRTKALYAASRIAPHTVYMALNRQIEKMLAPHLGAA